MPDPDLPALTARFRTEDCRALALMGSFARGAGGPFSDVDIVRFPVEDTGDGRGQTHLIGGRLVVVTDVAPESVERWFTEPEAATESIHGIRIARSLWDPDGHFAEIQDRALDFFWSETLQEKADRWASSELVGWSEEAHKALAGLEANDEGRLLCATFGLSWGLTAVVRVQRGILVTSDNRAYLDVAAPLGEDSRWTKLSRIAFGIEPSDLPTRVRAGLDLYVLTVEMMPEIFDDESRAIVDVTVSRIRARL